MRPATAVLVRNIVLAAMLLHVAGTPLRASLWDEYAASPDTHPNIPNCSWAGYQYGEKPIPSPDGPLINVRDHGAMGDGSADDTAAIRAALASVDPARGGVIWFPDGTYNVSGVLFVNTDRTVLRGQSRDATRIHFTRPLSTAFRDGKIRIAGAPPDRRLPSRWSWSGGLVWFTPASKATWTTQRLTEGWDAGPSLGAVSASARRGDRTLVLATPPPADALRPGDFIILRQNDTRPQNPTLIKNLCGDGPWADAYDWAQKTHAGYQRAVHLQWVVEVAAIDGTRLTLRQPLRSDVRSEWQPQVSLLGPVIRESGIENLTLGYARERVWTPALHNVDEGWNAPWFNAAIHCWLRNVTLIDADNGPGTAASKCVTLTGFTLKASRPALSKHHHATTCRTRSFDILFQDFAIETTPMHGLNVEHFSAGNVWSHGTMSHGTFDTHRNFPYDNIRTRITLNNDGNHGGVGGPPMGARFVNWNIKVTNNRNYMIGWANLMPQGAIVGLQGAAIVTDARPEETPTGDLARCRIENPGAVPDPPDLYEAQLRLRLSSRQD
ncbi:hypothetical protein OpiT1DRAFT_02732 [Opitutaceae bacterium TAV1]|nr:hypothetical protein OpiT1DRAFT_02732 [Opitutaceae bacterium TAV1]